jgi:hypothetical protein
MSQSQDRYRMELTTAAAVTAVPRTGTVVLGAFTAQPPAHPIALASLTDAR